MSITGSEVVTIIVSLGGLVTIIGGVVVQVVMAMRRESKVALESIEKHVNSAASASLAKIESLQAEITSLRANSADMKQIAALLAQNKVTLTEPTDLGIPTVLPSDIAAKTHDNLDHAKETLVQAKDTLSQTQETLKDVKK